MQNRRRSSVPRPDPFGRRRRVSSYPGRTAPGNRRAVPACWLPTIRAYVPALAVIDVVHEFCCHGQIRGVALASIGSIARAMV